MSQTPTTQTNMIKDNRAQNAKTKPNDRVLEKLHADFPQCFNKEGLFDIEKFQQLIKNDVDVTNEGYDLNFLGKNYANLIACTETETVIQPDIEHNAQPENVNSQNVYISGDNLDALKHLLKSYSGCVKCIYIDPPYNTGSDGFVYNDKFNFTAEQLQTKLGVSEEKAKRVLDLCTRGSASHSAWLMFMAPRLMLARDLLTKDGVIFISIDNNEQSNLKLLCDSIFGEENLCECFLWNKTSTPPALSKKSRKTHEYILCYQRFKNAEKFVGLINNEGDSPILNESNKECKLFFPSNYVHTNLKDGIYKKGKRERVDLLNDVVVKNGLITNDFSLVGRFRWTQDTLNQEIENHCYLVVKSDKFAIRYCRQDDRIVAPQNYLADRFWNNVDTVFDKDGCNVDTNETAGKEVENLFGLKVFDFPKPSSLISYLISFVIKTDDIVVDFFSGSGTTAQSVMQYSVKSDEKIRYILVQLPENLDESLSRADETAKQTICNGIQVCDEIDKPHTLDQIGIERIRRAADKIKSDLKNDISQFEKQLKTKEDKFAKASNQKSLFNVETPLIKEIESLKADIETKRNALETTDFGFKHYILQDVDKNTLDKMEKFEPNNDLSVEVSKDILQNFGKETVLETWCVKDGYGFSAEVEQQQLANYMVYYCGSHLYFIDGDNFNENAVIALIDKYNSDPSFNPQNIVLFGYSFTFTQTEMLRKNLNTLKDSAKNLNINIDVRY